MSALANWVASGRSAPILYLPLNDPTQPGKNLGTGGDFNLTGVVARSGRGPNQYNAPYSDLDGTADYLRRPSVTGIADGKQVTFSCVFKHDTINATNYLFSSADTTTGKILFFTQSGGSLTIRLRDAAGTNVLEFTLPSGTFVVGRNYVLTFSVDLTDTATRSVYVNGQATSATWVTYTNANADLTNTSYSVGVSSTSTRSGYFDGTIGNVFFDTRYIDLSVPANLAKFVTGTGIDAKPADLGANGELPFGTPPLIYLPMYGNNAGKNYGTGGDFTVNSGPFTGARGPNEFWGNKANIDGGDTLQQAGISSIANTKNLTFSGFIYPTTNSVDRKFACMQNSAASAHRGFLLDINASNQFRVFAYNSSGTPVLSATVTSPLIAVNTLHHILVSVDLTNTSNRAVYINGTAATVTWTTYTNADIAYSSGYYASIGTGAGGADPFNGWMSEFYFTTDYIDFSQEANRLKFRDAFGNPVALQPQIEAGTLPNPAIYMRFDPANFGKNSGTGGDFTVNGTITDGGQI